MVSDVPGKQLSNIALLLPLMMDTDRNLMFGVLALQADLIDTTQFAEACTNWTSRKETPISELLVERGWLSAEDCGVLEHLLKRKLERFSGDAQAGLASVTDDKVRHTLAGISDLQVQHSLANLPVPPPDHVLFSTVEQLPESRQRYNLIRLHATGGIGQVWLARDDVLERDIALKEMRPDKAQQPALAARFFKEAKITGQLEHPGIVPIHELGRNEKNEQPFYTMRFVRGRTLGQAVKNYHQRLIEGKAGSLERRELLNTFVSVCNTVAYAHSRGVIHRDLKPQNVVLGDYGEAVVLDWGLAKLVEQAGSESVHSPIATEIDDDKTVHGQVLGTPAYMSPEQADGRPDSIDSRSDVYGLGTVLYEILAGQVPFTGPATDEVLQKVRHELPNPPSQLVSKTPAALEAICLKAMSKKPEDRYATARELAEDVQRFLADEPVAAYPDPITTKVRRWISSHRVAVTGLAAAVLVGLISLSLFNLRLNVVNRRESEARKQAERNFQLAKKAVNDYFNLVAKDKELKRSGNHELRKRLLEAALPFYEKLTEQKPGDAQQKAEHGNAYSRLVEIYMELDYANKAEKNVKQMHKIFEGLVRQYPEKPDYRQQLAKCHYYWARLLHADNQFHEAHQKITLGVALWNKLTDGKTGDAVHRKELATSHNMRGTILKILKKPAESEEAYRRAVEIHEALAEEFPKEAEFQYEFVRSQLNLGLFLDQVGNRESAKKVFQESIENVKKLLQFDAEDPDYRFLSALISNNLGLLNLNVGKRPEAIAAFGRSLEQTDKLLVKHASIPVYHGLNALSYANLCHSTGKQPMAEERLETFLGALKQFDSAPNRIQALFHYGSAQCLQQLGHLDEALTQWNLAIDKDTEYNRFFFRMQRSVCLARAKRFDEALAEANKLKNSKENSGNSCFHLAKVFALSAAGKKQPGIRGDHAEHAVALLEKAAEEGFFAHPGNLELLRSDPDFEPIRQSAVFQEFFKNLQS